MTATQTETLSAKPTSEMTVDEMFAEIAQVGDIVARGKAAAPRRTELMTALTNLGESPTEIARAGRLTVRAVYFARDKKAADQAKE